MWAIVILLFILDWQLTLFGLVFALFPLSKLFFSVHGYARANNAHEFNVLDDVYIMKECNGAFMSNDTKAGDRITEWRQ